MDIQLIECKRIEFRKQAKELRSFNKEAAQGIASSIQAEGMYNPIVIRPNPEKPGHYLGVQGRHRHYAKGSILKEPLIECNVLDMDDAEADMAAITENLFRNELSAAQKSLSIKKWFAYFASKHPDKVRKGKDPAKGLENEKKAEPSSATAGAGASANLAPAGEDGSGSAGAEPGGGSQNFAETLAAATGVSKRTAAREQKVALNLTEEQLEVCEQMELTKGQMESLANIKDETKRAEVVNLVASGMEFDQAWAEVKPEARKATSKSREAVEAEAKAKDEKKPELTDDEWFATYCGEKATLLADPARYKADALVFRKITDSRHAFRAKIKGVLKDTRAGKVTGPFFNVVNRVVAVSHPRDWPLCGGCGGKGKDEAGEKCKTCYGSCYQLKTEEYL